ncbi:MAG: hydroxymethylglutaryl-CoA reductase, degradative [Calditrichaceae bacterium]|nr:hydroxymethylglutaryl-CoA reductase, degradative [Calditrichaceae bacterium]RQV94942.1 MAG: hydroxymethylglutaryl-CoA reductase, degradative [Calditrichota bacterium]
MPDSRIPGFYKLSVQERLRVLKSKKILNEEDFSKLRKGGSILKPEDFDKMIENVIGVFGLPIGLGLNFLVNGKDYIVPMVVEEPSIVAAVSSAAKVVRSAGGFSAESSDPVLIGQIQVMEVKNPAKAKKAVLQKKNELINLANSLHPHMAARGGGAKDVEVRILPDISEKREMVIVHLLVDTRDAMGANLVNSMCEGAAPLIEKITGGKVFLRILSNLADRSIVKAKCVIPVDLLEGKGYSGGKVRDGIILANDFALTDPYRAATHNKGIMNGIDSLIIATGNDWRAQEAAAHAYAARSGKYSALTLWGKNEKGDLTGEIELPVRVGIVGGPLESNPMVPIVHRILGIKSARELAELIAAVGLAQNMSAIRALATEGIQRGHMSLHARSVTLAAGAEPEIFESVVEKLIDSKEIKIWKAKEIIAQIKSGKGTAVNAEIQSPSTENLSTGFGKIILLGEHAVVYGSHAIAAPIPLAVQAKVSDAGKEGVHLIIPQWDVEETIVKGEKHEHSFYKSLEMILDELKLAGKNMNIEVFPHVPRAMGLGGSASLAVAVIRALSKHFNLNLDNERVRKLSFESEKIVHGSPSGIDNTLATYGKFLLYKKGDPPQITELHPKNPIRMVVGLTWTEGLTAETVGRVREAWTRNKRLYERLFDEINSMTLQGAEYIKSGDMARLGELMNFNQGLLNAIQVSGREIEELVDIARNNGALGAKLTGGGGGGAVIALCPDNAEAVASAIQNAGYRAFVTDLK